MTRETLNFLEWDYHEQHGGTLIADEDDFAEADERLHKILLAETKPTLEQMIPGV